MPIGCRLQRDTAAQRPRERRMAQARQRSPRIASALRRGGTWILVKLRTVHTARHIDRPGYRMGSDPGSAISERESRV